MQFQRQSVGPRMSAGPQPGAPHAASVDTRPRSLFQPKSFPWKAGGTADTSSIDSKSKQTDPDAPTKRIYQVLGKTTTVRAEPHMEAKMKTKKSNGARVFSTEITMNGWLKLDGEPGYMITDMRGLDDIGVVAQPQEEKGFLAVPEYQPQGLVCLEVVFKAGAAVVETPSRKAKVISTRRLGEYVFARSQNFDGWLKILGPDEGWMQLRCPKAGEQLKVRNTRDVHLWALADVWTAARKTRQSAFGTREIQALKDLERRVLLALGSHLAEVQETGSVEKIISEGLLTLEDLEDAASRVRCKLFANILVETVRNEPIFRDLTPGFEVSKHPLLLPATQQEEDELENAHMQESMAGWYAEGGAWDQGSEGPAVKPGFFNEASRSQGGGLTPEEIENTQPFIYGDKVYRMAANGILYDPPNEIPIGLWNAASQQVDPATCNVPGCPYPMLAYFGKNFVLLPDHSVVDPTTEEVVGLLNEETGQIEEVDPVQIKMMGSSGSSSGNGAGKSGPPLNDAEANEIMVDSMEKGEQLAEMGSFGEATEAFSRALDACRRMRSVDVDLECDILRKRAACWARTGGFKELLADSERILALNSEDKEADEWRRMASFELLKSMKTDSTTSSKGNKGYDAPWKPTKNDSAFSNGMGPGEKRCAYCAVIVDKPSICSKCRRTYYCGRACQRNHWKVHKHECGKQGDLSCTLASSRAAGDEDGAGMEELD